MTAYESALAAIAERRELIESLHKTTGEAFVYNDGQSWHVDPGVPYEVAPSVFYPVENDEREVIAVDCEITDATFIATFDPPRARSLLDTIAADTDALEAVLLRHAPTQPWPTSERIACGKCARNNAWPCPDAQAVLTALGIDPNGDTP